MNQAAQGRAGAERPATASVTNEQDREAFRFGDLSSYPFKKRLAIRAADLGFYGLIQVIARTVRFEVEGQEHWDAAADGGLPIYTFWHDSIVLATYFFRHRRIIVMTSQSFDGEYIARFIQRFGYGAARGSSTRGGIGALVEMIRLVKQGYPAAFTIDGPKGPRHEAKMGAVLLAKKTGQPILPFAITPAACWNLTRSWDRMGIPKPFSRALVGFAPPLYVPRDADDAALELKQAQLQTALDDLERGGELWRTSRARGC
jgi:lysophospholipid acyltransferase (LPLAT)-like uncharacterized protein